MWYLRLMKIDFFTIAGVIVIILGASMVISMFALKRTHFKNNKNLFYVIIFYLGLTQIFAGIAMLTKESSAFLSFSAGVCSGLSFIIGIILRKINLYKQ